MRTCVMGVFAGALFGVPAAAQDVEESEPMTAWEALERMPPRASYEIALHMSYGNIAYWAEENPPWVGYGFRFGWGRVFSDSNRLGVAGVLNVEGPVPLYYSVSLEPAFAWDWVSNFGLQLGASVGPAFMVHSELLVVGSKQTFTINPMVSARVGYSERWTRLGRRFFAALEPKFRYIQEVKRPDLSVAFVIGSGNGR